METTPAFADFDLAEPLLQAVQKLGFQQPTAVQLAAIPRALARHDLLVSTETGSGKTVAFLLPTLQQLLATPSKAYGTRALVIVPTRELAKQIYQQCQQLLKFTSLQVGLITGGADFRVQQTLLRKNAEIVIATPVRVLELMEAQTANFSRLEVLILDEADRMLDMGFSQALQTIAAAQPATSGVLQGKRVRCGVLHGEMDQKERNRIMALFRLGTINTLIATDLAARGLDILKAWNWSSISKGKKR